MNRFSHRESLPEENELAKLLKERKSSQFHFSQIADSITLFPQPGIAADPKALACYGLLRSDSAELWLRFVEGSRVSSITTDFLTWGCERLEEEGKKAWLVVWDNASWHTSAEVRNWSRERNRKAKQEGGLRIIVCQLPTKSPWLNPIEPRWMHGKRAVVEPDGKLTAQELKQRICDYYGCELLHHLSKKVA